MDVVETYFEHVAWDRDVGGQTRAWLTNSARDEPELYRMICLLDDDFSLYPRCRSSRWGDMLCCDQIKGLPKVVGIHGRCDESPW